MIIGSLNHVFLYEQGGSAFIAGVHSRSLPNEPDGTLKIEDIVASIRPNNVHYPITRVVALENTHNFCGGRVLPDGYIQAVSDAVKPFNVAVHIDGARIWNAAAASGKSIADLCRGADSVSVCLSKGLGAPLGSVLVGPREWISRARRVRKALGGGMRQAGVIAAACMQGIDDFEAGVLNADHLRAKRFAEAISLIPGYIIDLESVESNIVLIFIDETKSTLTAQDVSKLLKNLDVLVNNRDMKSLRVVMHRDLTDSDVDRLIGAFSEIAAVVRDRTTE